MVQMRVPKLIETDHPSGAGRRRRVRSFQAAGRPDDERGIAAKTLLLVVPGPSQPLLVRRNRWFTRQYVRLVGPQLDYQLAQGRQPETSRLLSARSHMLVAPPMRFALAESWRRMQEQARRRPALRDPRVPLDRQAVLAAEDQINELVEALLARVPVPVRGCAMASWLVTDAASPVYTGGGPDHLAGSLGVALEHLNPDTLLCEPPPHLAD
jgi:hypothetical protein